MKTTNHDMRQVQVAATLPLSEIRTLLSKVKNVIQGEATTIQTAAHAPPPQHSDW